MPKPRRRSSHNSGGSTAKSNSVRWFCSASSRMAATMSGARWAAARAPALSAGKGHVQSLTNQERPCATHLNGHGSGQRGPVAAPVRPVTSLPDVCVITAIYAEIMGRILRIRKLFTARNAAIKGGIRRKGTSRSAAPRLSLPGSQIAHARFLIHAEAVAPALLGGVKGHVGVMEQMV